MSRSKIKFSVIIPTFNEERHIDFCISSLFEQTVAENTEILIVDDGSTDQTIEKVRSVIDREKKSSKNIRIIRLSHRGPGECRNAGAKLSRGKILVFLDGDMFFARDFVEKLTQPIIESRTVVGTESQSEFLANPENFWAICWNIGRFSAVGNFSQDSRKIMVSDRRNHGGVFRAVRKTQFDKVGGFDLGGDYSDDGSLGKKLGVKSTLANKAIFFHFNPDSFKDVWLRAGWIGNNRELNQGISKYANLIKFSLPISILRGIVIGLKVKFIPFVMFKIVFDMSVWISILKSV